MLFGWGLGVGRSLGFAAALEVQVDGGHALAVLVARERLVFAPVARHHLGNLELGHVVQLLVVVERHFVTAAILERFLGVEPDSVCACVGLCVGGRIFCFFFLGGVEWE